MREMRGARCGVQEAGCRIIDEGVLVHSKRPIVRRPTLSRLSLFKILSQFLPDRRGLRTESQMPKLALRMVHPASYILYFES